ncbi:hypothetical protein B0H11DRAFT_1981311 [Mycena galericulata]|nr:hypothetical protein B0H11DRAFT_1981311 [Mycena galericulata]
MSCGICLSRLNEPICVPCGHVYCSDCVSAHVGATSADGFSAACPACREPFYTVRPELSCLPKPFHKFALPSLRRVYIDLEPLEAPPNRRSLIPESAHRTTTRPSGLEARLTASEARVAALEADKDRLLRACEQHAAAARAHARGETVALRKVTDLQRDLTQARVETAALRREGERAKDDLERTQEELEDTRQDLTQANEELATMREDTAEALETGADDLREAVATLAALRVKYTKMKKHCRTLEAEAGCVCRKNDTDCSGSSLIVTDKKRTSDVADPEDTAQGSTPKRLRVIRPLPRGRQSLQTPANASLYARLQDQGGLGSPFRSGA